MVVLERFVDLHRLVNFIFFSISGWGIDLIKSCMWTLVDSEGYSISPKRLLPTVVDTMVIGVTPPIQSVLVH